MIVWVNGAFGAGKTTTVQQLQLLLPHWRVFDPESVGFMLRPVLADVTVGDFQDWPAWRRLVVATAAELLRWPGQSLLCPQTVLRQAYWQELRSGLADRGVDVVHVLLDASADVLRERIEASGEAVEWRLDHVHAYEEARTWLLDEADVVVDVAANSASAAAAQVHRRLGAS